MKSSTILREMDLVIGSAKRSDVIRAYRSANDEWTIQACDAVELFPGRPEKHTTMSLTQALVSLGCDFRISEWRRSNRAA